MSDIKLSFNKRIALTKKEVFDLIQVEPLDKAGNDKSGYYSIKTIMAHLNQVMDKYDIDVDTIIVSTGTISVIWIDCLSDLTRCIPIDLKPIADIERLAMMQNIIQSEGAVMTYYRRYALTNALNLNATDRIENAPNQPQNKQNNNIQKPQPTTPNEPKQVSEAQLKRLFAISNKKGFTEADINKWIGKKFNKKSKKELTMSEYDILVKALENKPDKPE